MQKKQFLILQFIMIVFVVITMVQPVIGNPFVWEGTENDDWFEPLNWNPAAVPGDETVVTVSSGNILLTNETAELTSFTMSGGSLTLSNWTTRLRADTVDLQNGELTLPAAYSDEEGVMSNRIWIVCQDVTLGEDAVIDVVGLGYAAGAGVGAGGSRSGGAHGGSGGRGASAEILPQPYGSVAQPLTPGSGGSYDSTRDAHVGAGGGVVWIQASGTATINGQILADGADGQRYGGGGAGGSVYIDCTTFAGATSGLISVTGGTGVPWAGTHYYIGGGGGGRIAVDYTQVTGTPGVRFKATPGPGAADQALHLRHYRAGQGTLYLPDMALFSPLLTDDLFRDVELYIDGIQEWTVASLVVDNASLTFADPEFVVKVETDFRIDSNGALGLHGELVTLGGDLVVTNGGSLYVYSSPTNGLAVDYGARVTVTGDLRVATDSWIYPYAHETDGGTVLFEAQNVWIAAGGGIDADGGGYAPTWGNGSGASGSGAGYGGRGGGTAAGDVYGQPDDASQPGSGGSHTLQGGHGGGCVRIMASGTVTIDGTVSADGFRSSGNNGSGGSGGGIDIRCGVLDGNTTGLLRIRGGGGLFHSSAGWQNYSGGGGRIALGYNSLASGFGVRVDAGYDDGGQLSIPEAQRRVRPEPGTLWAPDLALLGENLDGERFKDVNLFLSGLTSWNIDALSLGDSSLTFGPTDFVLTVTNDLHIGDGGHLGVRGDIVVIHGDLTIDSGGSLTMYSAPTSGLGRAYGSLVDVGGTLSVDTAAWVYPYSDETDGGSVLFRAGNVTVSTNGGFDADGLGFTIGPGYRKSSRAGGGYGGRGGDQEHLVGGDTYGLTNAPALPGSGGGSIASGSGGGLIWIESEGTVTLNGILRAYGARSRSTGDGGGSGGGIMVSGRRVLSGPDALLVADGGDAIKHSASSHPDGWYTAGGGGGRIAVWREVPQHERTMLYAGQDLPRLRDRIAEDPFNRFSGITSVMGGTGYDDGQPGTLRFVDGTPSGTVFFIR